MKSIALQALLLLRPKQWSKNLLVFAAILFTGGFASGEKTTDALLAFVALCFASSAIYVLNDLLDIEKDRLHPKKRNRPLASGAVPPPIAWIFVPTLVLLALGLALLWVNLATAVLVAAYLVLHAVYNLGMKHTAVADVFAISLGFVLRAVVGAAAIDVRISGWLLFCTGSLALMLGYGKRRQEYLANGEDPGLTRKSLNDYSVSALDALLVMSAATAAMSYGIYAINSHTAQQFPALVFTSVPVIYGISRYILVAFTGEESAEPESLLFSDRHILLSVIVFVGLAAFAMSGFQVPFLEAPR